MKEISFIQALININKKNIFYRNINNKKASIEIIKENAIPVCSIHWGRWKILLSLH